MVVNRYAGRCIMTREEVESVSRALRTGDVEVLDDVHLLLLLESVWGWLCGMFVSMQQKRKGNV